MSDLFQWTTHEIAEKSRWLPGTLADQVHRGYVDFFRRRTGKLPPPVPKGYIEDLRTINIMLRAWNITD